MGRAGKKGKTFQANQWQPDPRQSLFLSYYIDPRSETFSNALQSALKAGYAQEYAEVITAQMPDWLAEGLSDMQMVKQALDNLVYFLSLDTVNEGTTKKGEVFTFNDPRLERIKADVSTFVLERLHKKKFAARQEVTGPGGGPIEYSLPAEEKDALDKLIAANRKKAGKND